MEEKQLPKKTELEDILSNLKQKAMEAESEKERKEIVDMILKLQALENTRKKNETEAILKLVQMFGIPILSVGALIVYRLLMETETPPDIMYRDMGKTILNFAMKKPFN